MLNNETLSIYSKDWKDEKLVAISSETYFDLAISKDFIYIIKVPKSGLQGAITLATGGLFGIFAGRYYERKQRDKIRSNWLDENEQFTIDNCRPHIFLQIPISSLKQSITVEDDRLIINFDGKKFKFKNKGEEIDKIAELIS